MRVRAEADRGLVGLKSFGEETSGNPAEDNCSVSLRASDPVALCVSIAIRKRDSLAVSAPELSSSCSMSLVSV